MEADENGFHPVRGLEVSPIKLERARQLRREMTRAERRLWQDLRAFRPLGYVFRRQQIIAGFIADFYCHRARLVIEVDGEIHTQQADYDTARDRLFAAHGLRTLSITNDQIEHDLPTVVSHILAACNNAQP